MDIDEIYAYMEQGRFDLAETALQASLAKSVTREAQALLVSLYIESSDHRKAEQALTLLQQIAPKDAYTLFLQARVHFMIGCSIGVIEDLHQALQGDGIQASIREKIYNLLGQCYRYFGDSEKSTDCYLQASRSADTEDLAALEYSNYLFNRHYLPVPEDARSLGIHLRYSDFFKKNKQFIHRRRKNCGNKIRIGYISPDFRNHVVLRFSYALLKYYDHASFEVYCYARGMQDQFSTAAAKLVDGWRNVSSCTFAETARCIYEDQIDILFDFSGHTQNGCLPVLAYRPAPVQLSGIGYFATTGLVAVDYFLGDRYLDDAAETDKAQIISSPDFCERLLVLPHSHFCYTPLVEVPVSLGAPCKKNGYITFGSFNNFTKVTDDMLGIWRVILERVQASRLLLKADIFHTEDGRKVVYERLRLAGFDLTRVELRGTNREYLPEYYEVDIALDTYPYPGGGTTCDALYMGVPVISFKGDSHGRRFGYSILINADLEEFIAVTWSQYIEKAVQLAQNFDLLDLLHRNLRTLVIHSRLMDGPAYLREVEEAYRKIWRGYCLEQPIPVYRKIGTYLPKLSSLAAQGDWEQAMALADFMIAAKPEEPYILEKIIEVYLDGKDLSAAETVLKLMHGDTKDGYDLFLQAEILFANGQWEKSVVLCEKALQMHKMTAIRQGAVHHLLAQLYKYLGKFPQSAEEYRLSSECKSQGEEKRIEYSNYLLGLHYFKGTLAERLEAAKGYDRLFPDIHHISIADREKRKGHEKIRIGYVSGDFCQHVAALFSRAFFEQYDSCVFDIYGYSFAAPNEVSAHMSSSATFWREMKGWSFADAAQQIAADEIDILVDLSGHTGTSCLPLFAYRPAPIQISGIGYFGPTGLKTMDYFLADRCTVPDEKQIIEGSLYGFSEALLLMPRTHLCYTPQSLAPDSAPAPCRENGWVTFGCFNNFAKVTDDMLRIWSCILAEIPHARLLLKSKIFDCLAGRRFALKRLKDVGIEEQRVTLEGESADYLACYSQIDIALDTYPYPGGGTTCDALYMGVPVISLVGSSHHERFGYSLLKNTGVVELAAFSSQEYIQKAVDLARDTSRLIALHQILRRKLQQSPVMDAAGYMFELEELYMKCWNRWLWSDHMHEQSKIIEQELVDLHTFSSVGQWDCVDRVSINLLGQGVSMRSLWSSLAVANYRRHRYPQTVFAVHRALSLIDDGAQLSSVDLYFILGQSLRISNRSVEAQHAFECAWTYLQQGGVTVDPEMRYKLLVAIALGHFRMGRERAANDYYRAYKAADGLKMRCDMYSSWLFTFHHWECDARQLFQYHLGYRALFQGVRPYTQYRYRDEKIRIGYVSGDFREHVMYNFLFWLLAGYDHDRFEVYIYNMAEPQCADAYTAILRPFVDVWRDIANQTYEYAAEMIHTDQISILFDLSGHSSGSGLPIFAWKPAPIQISGLGYMDTTGLSTVDYFLADAYTIPENTASEQFFSEKIVRLTSQFCYFGTKLPMAQGAPCKHRGYILFGVFNHYRKITDEMLMAWYEILQQVPHSKILLKSQMFVNLSVQDEAYARMNAMGFEMDRVRFEPATRDYMYRYLDVDIALDTYPYPGGGTTCDALYMGVPVITRYGQRHGSRFGYSILQNIGVPELAVPDREKYIECAIGLAKDIELLDILHKQLRYMMQKSILMDGSAYMKELEKLYMNLWHKYRK